VNLRYPDLLFSVVELYQTSPNVTLLTVYVHFYIIEYTFFHLHVVVFFTSLLQVNVSMTIVANCHVFLSPIRN
jgi:hypothetical protein